MYSLKMIFSAGPSEFPIFDTTRFPHPKRHTLTGGEVSHAR